MITWSEYSVCRTMNNALHAYDSDPYEVWVKHRCRVIMGGGRTDRNGIGIEQEQRAGVTVMYRGVVIVSIQIVLTMFEIVSKRWKT